MNNNVTENTIENFAIKLLEHIGTQQHRDFCNLNQVVIKDDILQAASMILSVSCAMLIRMN